MINNRIAKLRAIMKEKNVDMYFIPTSDFHDSEYVHDYFKARSYMSGFTGSAGILIVTQQQAVLWSDGRYYIQAEKQLVNTCIDFYRQGDPTFPTPLQYICKELKEGQTLGFDGRVVSTVFAENVERALQDKHITISYDEDVVGLIWENRPNLPQSSVFVYDVKYCGKTMQDKLYEIRQKMQQAKATMHVLTSLDDIAYVCNLRGNDIPCNPVFLSYLIITQDCVTMYIDEQKLDAQVRAYLQENDVKVCGYNSIYEDVKQIENSNVVMVDKERCNYTIVKNIKAKVIHVVNPTTLMKAIKNDVEIQNTKWAHIKDGVAVTKFMYWLKTNIGKIEMDELLVDEYISAQREKQEHFIDKSFSTIAAYNANAAMMHYSATAKNYAKLKPEGLLLVDSGGQYLEGTTDITRTFALGEVEAEWKKHFTLVLKGMSQLSRAKFLDGVSGINLDILARAPLWEHGIDYKCGTGHGVGHLLGVHEGPHGIRWQKLLNRKEDTKLMVGMNVTNEPGVYVAGSHGIRIENELLVVEDCVNSDGRFLSFECMTFAPIDIDAIDVNYLDEATRNWLNTYHKQVFDKISPYLNAEEVVWLKEYTRAI